MHKLLQRYAALIESGDITEFGEIPNKTFTFGELQYLFGKGYIFADGSTFRAGVTDDLGE